MKRAAVLVALALLASTGAAVTASIQPSSPSDITLDSGNDYEVFAEFDGTGSTDVTTYTWNLVDTDQSDTGPTANFTFDRTVAASNTIRLTASNATDSDTAEVTQVVHDVPTIDSTSHSPSNPSTGSSVTFDVSTTNSFDGPLNYSWTYSGTTKYGSSAAFSFSSGGDKDVTLTVEDAAGNTASATETVSVQSDDSDGGDSGDGGGGGTGGGGGGGLSLPQEAAVDLTRTADRFQVTVSNAKANTTVDITLFRNMTDDEPGVGVDRVTIGVKKDGDYRVNVSSHRDPPAGASAFADENASAARGYLQIDADRGDADIENATVRFRVNRSRLATGDPANVRLHRYSDGWTALPTTHVAEEAQYHVFEAETPGFSTFAVVEQQPNVSVVDRSLDAATVETGGTVSATVTLRNTGSAAGTETVTLTVAGETTTRDVTVAAGATEQVTLSVTAPGAGNYTASVNGADIGAVTVQRSPDDGQEGDGGGGIPVIPIAAALLVVAVLALGYVFRDTLQEKLAALGGDDEPGYSTELGPVRGGDRREQ